MRSRWTRVSSRADSGPNTIEIAAYGTLIAWAKTLGHNDVADLLAETLEEEKAADEKLTSLAESGVNAGAANGVGRQATPRKTSGRGRQRSGAKNRARTH
ncbi:MAG TPA: DUF892 family protein [Vicinamibacterales bacterium]|jgi:hypothetical protein|nr:DUF892 family protein [Vicinamibacterales bacterium]